MLCNAKHTLRINDPNIPFLVLQLCLASPLEQHNVHGPAQLTHLFLRNSWRFGLWRCWYALISQRLSLPNRRVSYWASINCLLRSLLPWFSAMFQSVIFVTTQLLFIPQKNPVPSASTNCCTPQTNCSKLCIFWFSFICRTGSLDDDSSLIGWALERESLQADIFGSWVVLKQRVWWEIEINTVITW